MSDLTILTREFKYDAHMRKRKFYQVSEHKCCGRNILIYIPSILPGCRILKISAFSMSSAVSNRPDTAFLRP